MTGPDTPAGETLAISFVKPQEPPLHQIDAIVQGQSVMLATHATYIVFALLATIGAAIIWLAPRPRRRTGAV